MFDFLQGINPQMLAMGGVPQLQQAMTMAPDQIVNNLGGAMGGGFNFLNNMPNLTPDANPYLINGKSPAQEQKQDMSGLMPGFASLGNRNQQPQARAQGAGIQRMNPIGQMMFPPMAQMMRR